MNTDARLAREEADKLWRLANRHNAETSDHVKASLARELCNLVQEYLDPPAPPTMADIEWDDETHAGLCADHPDNGMVRMIHAEHTLIWCYHGTRMGWLAKADLTPIPDTRVDLTPRRTHAETVTAASIEDYKSGRVVDFDDKTLLPCPEDVKPDPQPGEAWLIEYGGRRHEAVYWYSEIYPHWTFVYDGLCTVDSSEATPVSRLVPESTPDHPTTLTTKEDYENAPEGTIVASDACFPRVKDRLGFWVGCGAFGAENSAEAARRARRVLRWGESL